MSSITSNMRTIGVSGSAAILSVISCLGTAAIGSGCAQPVSTRTWGVTAYETEVAALSPRVNAELAKPIDQRSKEAGILLLDYAACCMSVGKFEAAQRALYEAILLTNDLSLGESSGRASLVFDESMKVWQGEAYERAMIELLHGVCLMRLGDFENARVAFDRALICDRFSKGALAEIEGSIGDNGQFVQSDSCTSKGGSLFQRDFLAAYLLRTICYLKTGRKALAADSWKQARSTCDEIQLAIQHTYDNENPIPWTGYDGRYDYPNIYVPPTGNFRGVGQDIFSADLDALGTANLIVIAASGNRPKKLRVGMNKGDDTNFLHDDYFMPIQAIRQIGLNIDGVFAGYMKQCLDLYGQAAGRGPSIKDLAQKKKGEVEDFARALQKTDNNYLKLIGLIIRATNQEEADVRQWTLLPNSVHIWMNRVEPGTHRVTFLPSGENLPSRDYYFIDRAFSSVLQQTEIKYARSLADAPTLLFAPRHVRSMDVEIPNTGSVVLYVAEAFNLEVTGVESESPRAIELLPRRTPKTQ